LAGNWPMGRMNALPAPVKIRKANKKGTLRYLLPDDVQSVAGRDVVCGVLPDAHNSEYMFALLQTCGAFVDRRG
jgi:hypothetical protein